ncbi:MAG: GNAT family N-acetyltransferase [Pseudomonadota bacterium]|nr:GNAT family N-acetyltransferase [Pseudomonadota bacterium]
MTPEAMAEIYAAAFPHSRAWGAAEISDMLASRLTFAIESKYGFALGRVIADEAELLTIAVDPAHQGKGLGHILLTQFEAESKLRGAGWVHLEVAQDNTAALALYTRAGYEICGERPGYYSRPNGEQITASLMKKALR